MRPCQQSARGVEGELFCEQERTDRWLLPQDSLPLSEDMEGDGDATFIWGTNLSVSRIQSRFNVFVREFKEEGEEEPKYLRLLQEVRRAFHALIGRLLESRLNGSARGEAGRSPAPEAAAGGEGAVVGMRGLCDS